MDTGGPMATPIETLTLAHWFSPAFPVGGFAYSHGLEHAIDTGAVRSRAQVQDWIETMLHHGAGWNDCLLIGSGFGASDDAARAEVDAIARALCASRERLMEADLQGRAFCKAVNALHGLSLAPLTYPVAIGSAAQLCALPLPLTLQFYLQAFCSTLASVAMRLVPLGQTEGHGLITQLSGACIEIAERAAQSDLEALSSIAFLGDIAAMHHETQYSRTFRT